MDVFSGGGFLPVGMTRTSVAAGVDPARPDRLILRSAALPTIPLAVIAAALLALAYVLGGLVPPLLLVLPAAALGVLFGLRRWTLIDRTAGSFRQGWGLLFPWRLASAPLQEFRAVIVERDETVIRRSKKGAKQTTEYRVGLQEDRGIRHLATARAWEATAPLAELLARFLRLPIDDRATNSIRSLEDLDRGLGDAFPGEPETPPSRSGSASFRVEDPPGGPLRISIPPPRKYIYFLFCGMLFFFWTLPKLADGELALGLVPMAVVAGIALKFAFGYRAELALSAGGLRVRTTGLVLRRTVVFPLPELEELVLVRSEWGGLRSLSADVFPGVLVARSDRAAVRFGHGLGWSDLEQIRRILQARVVELQRQAAPGMASAWRAAGPAAVPEPLPAIHRPVLPLLGVALGAAVAHFAAGPLGACLAVPFAEHVLNVGGVLGAAVGLWFDRQPAARTWGSAVWLGLFAALVAAGVLGLIRPDLWPCQPAPRFDEAAYLAGRMSGDVELFNVALMLAVLAVAPLVIAPLGTPLRLLAPEGRLAPAGETPSTPSVPATLSGWKRLAGIVLVIGSGVVLIIGFQFLEEATRSYPPQGPPDTASALPGGQDAAASPDAATALQETPPPGASLPAEAGPAQSQPAIPSEAECRAVPVPVRRQEAPGRFTVYRFGTGLDKVQFLPVAVDGPDVWIGTGEGLLRFSPGDGTAALYDSRSGMPGERISVLAVRDGRVAADLARMTGAHTCTGLGVFRMDPGRLGWRRVLDGAWDLRWDGPVLWAAQGRELGAIEGPEGEPRRVPAGPGGPRHGSVSCLAVAPAELWCGMFGDYGKETKDFQGGGVSRLDRGSGRWAHFSTADGLARDYTCDLAADEREVWAAHWDEERGLSRFDRAAGRWSAVLRSTDGAEIGGTRLALDGAVLWVGQQRGLLRLDRTTLRATLYREADGLPGYIVGGIAVAPDAVWVTAYAYDGQGGVRSAGLVRLPR